MNTGNVVICDIESINMINKEHAIIIYKCNEIDTKDLERIIFIKKTHIDCQIIICISIISEVLKQLLQEVGIGIGIRENQKSLCEYCMDCNELKNLGINYINDVLKIRSSEISYLCQRAINLVVSDFPNSRQLKIAQKLGISSDYLSMIMKKDIKMNFRNFVNKLKLFLAKELLRNYEIWLVAEKLGYNEVNNFYRFFKKNEGVTPFAFGRKSYRKY